MLSLWYELDCVYAKVASLHGGHAHCAHYGVLTCVLIYGVNPSSLLKEISLCSKVRWGST
jgi:hypothetical protein